MFENKLESPRDIPQVEVVLSAQELAPYVVAYSRPFVTNVIRETFDHYRSLLKDGTSVDGSEVLDAILGNLERERFKFFNRVINCSGIVIHTNLGRSPLGKARAEVLAERLSGYSNLEYDILPGKRGKRGRHVSRLFAMLAGSEAACVVNNNAAAVYLILNTFCSGRECVVSRSELVQIGGGFRMPDVMRASGAILQEVGTTNRAAFDDYFRAVNDKTGLIAKIHWSNFRIEGFTESVEASQLAQLGREKGIPVMFDLGSGSWLRPEEYGAKDEPSISSAIESKVDLVCFSGDKLFGGPQAGIVLGRNDRIEMLLKNPLYRAFRPDKMTLFLLEETLLTYLSGKATSDIPALSLLTTPLNLLKMRADRICGSLKNAGIASSIVETTALVGGGSAPEEKLESLGVRLDMKTDPDELAARFRKANPPVIGRIIDDCYVLDLKAVFKDEDDELIEVIKDVIRS